MFLNKTFASNVTYFLLQIITVMAVIETPLRIQSQFNGFHGCMREEGV